MAAPATVITLLAGGSTFTAEWALGHVFNWKIPLATILLAAGMEGFSALDRNGATLLSLFVLIGAVTTKFDGHSVIDLVTDLATGTGKLAGATGQSKTAAQ